jgi:hypothetical protein
MGVLEEISAMSKEQTAEGADPSCACGTTRSSRGAIPERDYSTLGTVYLLWGGTARPTKVTFRCVYCGEVFDECTNKKELDAYVI